jgi:hypothetical protein
MIAYQTDPNGFYLYETPCQIDPLASDAAGRTVWLLPRGAVSIAPPEVKPYTARRWFNDEWIYVSDYRGCFVYQLDDRMLIETIGDIPEGWSLTVSEEWLLKEENERKKLWRENNIQQLTVTVDGYMFDANRESINAMLSAIESSLFLKQESIPVWIMADNEVIRNLPLVVLRKAHALAVNKIHELMSASKTK